MAYKKGEPLLVSPSMVNTFLKCGVLGRKVYIEGLKIPPAFAMVQGTGLHAGVEAHMKTKMQTGDDPKVEVALDAAAEAIHKELDARAKQIKASGINPDPDPEDSADSLEIKVLSAVRVFHADAAPRLMPLESESWIQIPMDNVHAILRGRKDLVTKEIVDWESRTLGEGKAVVDVKFQKSKPTPSDVLNNVGLMTYAVAQKCEDQGKPPAQAALIAVTKTKQPEVVFASAIPTEDDEYRLMGQYGRVIDSINKGVFLPASPFAWWCSAKSCGHFATCKERLRV